MTLRSAMAAGVVPLRIVICTKRDLAGCMILNALLPALAGCPVLVLLSDKTREVEKAVPELAELKSLERDLPMDKLFPLIDRSGGDNAPLATFDGCAARFGVPMKIVDDINGPLAESLIRDFGPDLMVSSRFSLIFKPQVFDLPRLGTYNIHPGRLPRYAGLFAPFRGLLEGASHIGCTLHRVDCGIDTGPVVGVGDLAVDPQRSLLWHVVNVYRPGIDLFLSMLERMRRGEAIATVAQDRSQRDYGSLPDGPAFAAFHAKGLKLFDTAEYLEILGDFLAPGLSLADLGLADLGANAKGWQEPCCCAHA